MEKTNLLKSEDCLVLASSQVSTENQILWLMEAQARALLAVADVLTEINRKMK
jgi:hypothetical protein